MSCSDGGPGPGRGAIVARLALLAVIGCIGPAVAATGSAAASAPATAPSQPPPAAMKKAAPAAPVKLVDINGASRNELKTLPGVDDALADKIIANRPYLSKAELVSKNVLPTGPYLSLKDKVVALQKTPPKKTDGMTAAKPASGAAGKTSAQK
jgi:competence protein ComEA